MKGFEVMIVPLMIDNKVREEIKRIKELAKEHVLTWEMASKFEDLLKLGLVWDEKFDKDSQMAINVVEPLSGDISELEEKK